MNIFYLHHDPVQCAQAHYDRHLGKMILESAQMLSTAWWVHDPRTAQALFNNANIYKSTHANHPSAKWVRESVWHWRWLKDLALALDAERKVRKPKCTSHKSAVLIMNMVEPDLPYAKFTAPPLAGPVFRVNAIESYRDYYAQDKAHLYGYTNRKPPAWMAKYLK